MSSRGRRPSGSSSRSSSSRSSAPSRGARSSSQASRGGRGAGGTRRSAAAEPPARRRPPRRKSSVGPAIAATVVLGILAIVLFVVIRSQQSERKVEEKLAEIESTSSEPEAEFDRYAAGEAVQRRLAMKEAQEEAKRRAEEDAPERAPRRVYDVRPLPHLEDTPEELRSEIDRAIEALVQLDDNHASDAARADLLRIGRPAVPRLLNRFVGLEMDREEHIVRANILHRTLSELVRLPDGREIGFVPQEETTPRYVNARRQSIQRWYRWWADEGDSFE